MRTTTSLGPPRSSHYAPGQAKTREVHVISEQGEKGVTQEKILESRKESKANEQRKGRKLGEREQREQSDWQNRAINQPLGESR
jgi:hypothetical protein